MDSFYSQFYETILPFFCGKSRNRDGGGILPPKELYKNIRSRLCGSEYQKILVISVT